MNAQIRRLMRVVIAMFVVLMISSTYVQFIQAPSLKADSRNARTIYETSGRDRGQIIVAGKAIVSSQPSNDAFKFQRIYAQGQLYAPLTGYYSANLKSSTGLEKETNDILVGDAPSLLAQRNQRLFTGREPQGGSIELTIDPAVQQAAWDALGGRRGAVAAINPQTGEILAAVSSPSFDPNKLVVHNNTQALEAAKQMENDPTKPLDNRVFGGHRYFPGSVFKLVTAAAMLSNGDITPETLVDSPDELPLPQSTAVLKNSHNQKCGDGKPTLQYAFAQSCNTTFAKAAMDIGYERLRQQAEEFGFNDSNRIPLPVTPSVFPHDSGISQANLAMAGIGQHDVQVTPLHMAQIAGAIGNGGVMMKPYVVSRILDANLNETRKNSPRKQGEPISEATAQQLTEMMKATVREGTGSKAAVSGVEVAGKTGTAEVGDTGRADAWFVGFAPAENPTIAFAVVVEGGQNGIDTAFGGEVAAPIAQRVVSAHIASMKENTPASVSGEEGR
ncbi:MAG: penicillin-binding protein 2 [Actinomycetaceae bacterium]|nr:penicillin-binding protein 2 [Actinomycetaceae bacterium]